MRSLFTLVVAVVLSCVGAAQEKRPGALGQTIQYINLLKTPAIQKELDLADFQFVELEKLNLRLKAVMGDVLPRVDTMPKEERQIALSKMQDELASIQADAYNMLLPFQKTRVDQLAKQAQIRASEPTAGLMHYKMVAALGLSETQLQAIREKSAEVDAKLQEKLNRLRQEIDSEKDKARREILALLTDQQRKDYNAMLGAIIELTVSPTPIQRSQNAQGPMR